MTGCHAGAGCASSSRTGASDGILPFDVAARLQQAMRDAGLRVTWVPFDGGHEMPMTVVDALNAFLRPDENPDAFPTRSTR